MGQLKTVWGGYEAFVIISAECRRRLSKVEKTGSQHHRYGFNRLMMLPITDEIGSWLLPAHPFSHDSRHHVHQYSPQPRRPRNIVQGRGKLGQGRTENQFARIVRTSSAVKH